MTHAISRRRGITWPSPSACRALGHKILHLGSFLLNCRETHGNLDLAWMWGYRRKMQTPMFRAKSVYSSPTTKIVKIEGMVKEADIEPWSDLMAELSKSSTTELVLDFSSVGFLDPRAVNVLRQHITERMYLLNCSSLVRNMLQTTGLRRNVLD